jgi:hypothetical protein
MPQFANDARQVILASNKNLLTVFETMDTLSMTTTTFMNEEYIHNNGIYPLGFVTPPDAELHLATARKETDAYFIAYAPTIQGPDYELWSAYVEENIGWLEESWVTYSKNDPEQSFDGIHETVARKVESQIWGVNVLDEDGDPIILHSESCHEDQAADVENWAVTIQDPKDGPAAPIWTFSPPPRPDESRINFDMLSSHIYEKTATSVDDYRQSSFQDICKLTTVSYSVWCEQDMKKENY